MHLYDEEPEVEATVENEEEVTAVETIEAVEEPTTEEPEAVAAVATDEDDEEDDPTGDIMASSDDEDEDVDPSVDELDEEDHSEASDNGLKRGDLIEGTVAKNSPTEVLIDVGIDVPGVVNYRELEYLTKSTLDALQEGNKVWVYILSPANREGRPVLAIGRAKEELNWRQAQEYMDDKQVYEGKIDGYNKGGLIVRFGRIRGFVPASQISASRRARAQGETPEERWGEMIGEEVAVKVVEIKRSRSRLILSEQAAQSELRALEKGKLLADLKVGETRNGTVTSLTDFGAFVDIGGADGLVHVTELSWQHVDHPSEIVKVGQQVDVEVISVDAENTRIGLSMRSLSKDPWKAVADDYIVGQLVQATITKLTKFGAFARLVDHEDIEGLVHVSELAEHRVKHPREMVNVGDVMTLRIVKIDHKQRRLGLSLKRVDSPEYLDIDWQIAESDLNN